MLPVIYRVLLVKMQDCCRHVSKYLGVAGNPTHNCTSTEVEKWRSDILCFKQQELWACYEAVLSTEQAQDHSLLLRSPEDGLLLAVSAVNIYVQLHNTKHFWHVLSHQTHAYHFQQKITFIHKI